MVSHKGKEKVGELAEDQQFNKAGVSSSKESELAIAQIVHQRPEGQLLPEMEPEQQYQGGTKTSL